VSKNNGQWRREEKEKKVGSVEPRPGHLAATLAGKLTGHLSAMQANVSNLGNTINATIEAQNRQAVTTLVIKELLVEKGLVSLEELNARILAKRQTMLTPDGDVVLPPAVSGTKEEADGLAKGQEENTSGDQGGDGGPGEVAPGQEREGPSQAQGQVGQAEGSPAQPG